MDSIRNNMLLLQRSRGTWVVRASWRHCLCCLNCYCPDCNDKYLNTDHNTTMMLMKLIMIKMTLITAKIEVTHVTYSCQMHNSVGYSSKGTYIIYSWGAKRGISLPCVTLARLYAGYDVWTSHKITCRGRVTLESHSWMLFARCMP